MSEKECIHCGSFIPKYMKGSSFCCTGCEFVYGMIHKLDLQRYYQLKDAKISPLVGMLRRKEDLSWLDLLLQKQEGVLTASISGVQCAACVWLVQEIGKKIGPAKISVNTAYGVIRVQYDASSFDIKAFFQQLHCFGYVSGPLSSDQKSVNNHNLLIRVGVCAALAMNAMMFSASIYTGLRFADHPLLFFWVTNSNLLLATIALLVGGMYFIKRALQALRSGLLHFDLPIALGIILAYTGSLYTHFFLDPEVAYFDTVTVFITLMLMGRLIQERMVARNKQKVGQLKTHAEFHIRRKTRDCIEEVAFTQLQQGDRILITKGGIFPVDCQLSETVEVDLSWINGEPDPEKIEAGDIVVAGAMLLGSTTVEAVCQQDYQQASLAQLLTPIDCQESMPMLWQWLARYYVLSVLVLTAVGFLIGYQYAGVAAAISIAVSIAVVTCPCSLGLAIPLARTITYRYLMQQGVFVQSPHTLDRLDSIKHIALDKTGTITLSELHWDNTELLTSLDSELKALLWNATAQSYHPASRAIFDKLQSCDCPVLQLKVREEIGQGLHFEYAGQKYMIGRPQQAATSLVQSQYRVAVVKNDIEIATILLREVMQENMSSVVSQLQEQAKQVHVISGDRLDRVAQVAQEIGVPDENIYADCSPEGKKALVQKLSQKPLMYVGDGLNDQLAIKEASVSALSLHNQLQSVQKAHLYFLSQSMSWLPKIFDISAGLRKVVRGNIWFLLVYNTCTVTLAMMGLITPLICAIIMPASSVLVISMTLKTMKKMM